MRKPANNFAVERRAIKPSGRPPDKTTRTWRDDYADYKAQQQPAGTKTKVMVSEVEAYIGRIRGAHNDTDTLRSMAEKLVNVDHSEKVMDHMESRVDGVYVYAKNGAVEQLKLRMGMTFSMVPMEMPDHSLPSMPRGLRGFIKKMGRD